jgi:hydroxyacylglutathione hydrolase
MEVAPKIRRYIKDYGVSYIIEDGKIIQIDAGAPTDKKPEILILTHSHFDHTAFMPDCEVWVSERCAKHISTMDEVTLVEKFGAARKLIKASRILEDGDIVKTGTYSFKVIETPGHTDGSICLYDEDKHILFSGDTMFDEGIYGRTDLPTGDESMLKKSINKLLSLRIDVLLPGHLT